MPPGLSLDNGPECLRFVHPDAKGLLDGGTAALSFGLCDDVYGFAGRALSGTRPLMDAQSDVLYTAHGF